LNIARSFDIFMRGVEVGSRAVAKYRLELDKPDVIIRPKVQGIDLLDIVVVRDVAQLGEDAVKEMLPQLKRAVSWQRRVGKKLFGSN